MTLTVTGRATLSRVNDRRAAGAKPKRCLVILLLHDITSHHDTIPTIPESTTTHSGADALGRAENMPTQN